MNSIRAVYRHAAVIAVLCAFIFCVCGFSCCSGADWPAFRGPNRNGIVPVELKLLDVPQELWKVENLGVKYRGAPVISKGRLYITGGVPEDRSQPQLYCLDADTGAEIWKAGAGRTHSTPVVHEGRVYVQDDQLQVRCFAADSGDEIWSREMPESTERRGWGHSGSPLVWEDLLILNYGNGVALDLNTGETVWQFEGFAGLASPVMFSYRGKASVAIFCGDKLIARAARTGEELWSIPWVTKSGVNACDPLFIDDDSKLYLSSRYGLGRTLYDISGDEPKEIWSGNTGSTYSSSIYRDGKLYTLDGSLGRLDLKTGQRVARGPSGYSVLVIGDAFVLLGGSGELRIGLFSNDRFKEVVRAQIADGQTWNVPAYWQGRLYVRNHEGVLVCVRIGDEA